MESECSNITVEKITAYLINLGDKKTAEHSLRFFKTGKGQYGEGDCFLGIRVPVLRETVKKYKQVELSIVEELLHSQWHEVRLLAVLLMVDKYKKKKPDLKDTVYAAYVRNLERINNWDLVDSSAPYISGPYLWEHNRSILNEWINSSSLWIRRIAVMSTYYFIRQHHYDVTLTLCAELLNDNEDLIHKAAGWMLREIGNRDKHAETAFLKKYCSIMPRTMLRYAIEKFPEQERKAWLSGSSGV